MGTSWNPFRDEGALLADDEVLIVLSMCAKLGFVGNACGDPWYDEQSDSDGVVLVVMLLIVFRPALLE